MGDRGWSGQGHRVLGHREHCWRTVNREGHLRGSRHGRWERPQLGAEVESVTALLSRDDSDSLTETTVLGRSRFRGRDGGTLNLIRIKTNEAGTTEWQPKRDLRFT